MHINAARRSSAYTDLDDLKRNPIADVQKELRSQQQGGVQMKILIAFGSTEGHTRKIAHHINTFNQENSHSSEIIECGSADKKPDVASFDAIIVAGSVHQQVHQQSVVDFVKENLSVLKSKPSGFISVSLSVSLEEGQEEAKEYVKDFAKETGWQPEHVHMAGGAIRSLEYDYFKRFTVEHIVLKGNKMPEKSAGNPEFTDWDALDRFVIELLGSS
ncbi:MAG: flavodoxin domain-containing protein [Rhizobiaceae bacterium]